MATTWTVRAQRDDQWVTEHESTRFMDAWRAWVDDDTNILLRDGRVMHKTDTSEQLTFEETSWPISETSASPATPTAT